MSAFEPLRHVCVYCGSREGADPAYADSARTLAAEMAGGGLGLVYGGGSVGIMGVVADAMLERGGSVLGVIPSALFSREVAHQGLTELAEVDGMHPRKAMMMERADAFIALPGGLGTLEELFEALTWTQIGIHAKPCGVLNVGGFYDHLLRFLDHLVEQGFVHERNREHLIADDDPRRLLERLAAKARAGGDGLAVEWATAHDRG